MTRSYSPKAVFRHLPAPVVRLLFDRFSLSLGIDWESEPTPDDIGTAWQALPEAGRLPVEKVLRDVHELACEDGITALLEECAVRGVGLADALTGLDGLHHKALWAYLHHPEPFRLASLITHAEHLPGRFWTKHTDLPAVVPPVPLDDRLAGFRAALAGFYTLKQGRGHRCSVDWYVRRRRECYLFAYPDDFVDTHVGHDAAGVLVRTPQRSVFEVVFVFDPAAGALELFAHGGAKLKQNLITIFCREMLGREPPPESRKRPPYELNGLLSPGFDFATDPEDGIDEVRVRKLRLSFIGDPSVRFTVEADLQQPPNHIYARLADRLGVEVKAKSLINLTLATIRMTFAEVGGERRKPLQFDVSYPNGCTLRSKSEPDQALGLKYLARWGISRD